MAENQQKVLANIAKFYREALRRDKTGRELARSLGIHDDQVLERFQVGYANGSLLRAIPSKGGIRDVLVELGLLTKDGQEASLPLAAVTKAKLEMTDALIEEHRRAHQGPAEAH